MYSILVLMALTPSLALAQISGKSYPVDVDASTELLFQSINPTINWDIMNYLVDLSGPYTLCSKVGQSGFFDVDEKTKDGASIGGLVDDTVGNGFTADVVKKDIMRVMNKWIVTKPFSDQIKKAKKFGCSVAPACRGKTVVACLFSPSYIAFQEGRPVSEVTAPPKRPENNRNRGGRKLGLGKALAFTEEQIKQVETILNVKWDRTNFLEDLSGFETDCKMMTARHWTWKDAKAEASNRGLIVHGMYGSVSFKTSTTDAISMILVGWQTPHHGKEVGCSAIPDCMSRDGFTETVVISCLFSKHKTGRLLHRH